MMNVVHLKKGFSPRVAGSPGTSLRNLARPDHVGLVPAQIPFVKPRLRVKKGDSVSIGTPIFEDKRDPRIVFVSPGGGVVEDIVFGRRHVIEKIVIRLDASETARSFSVPPVDGLTGMSRASLVTLLLEAGMWPFLRCLPFMDIASPDALAPIIMVRLGDDEPFSPEPEIYLDGCEDAFSAGLSLLTCLCGEVRVCTIGDLNAPSVFPAALLEKIAFQRFSGPYPSGNPAVQLYHTKTGPEENRAWFIDGQDVVLLGRFIQTGQYPTARVMTVGGALAPETDHVRTRAGVPLSALVSGKIPDTPVLRYIVGGMFTGFTGSSDSFMGFFQNALALMDAGDREEFLAFIRPGAKKPSCSSAFLSVFRKTPLPMDCGQHGEVRACVNCGTCARICPVEILPQFTMKCLIADEVEEALAHGLLDCAECGLCTYACPSKITLREIFRSAKAKYYQETAG